nr:response regulator [Candidatus Wallbacteria bacterium]
VENANISAQSLLGIINDILDFSKIEAGRIELETIKTDITELVETASDIIKFQASKKNLELLINIHPDTPNFAAVDPVRLKQVLVNLLSNAVKFTDSGEIEIKLRFSKIDDRKGRYFFEVRDTGIGISEEQKAKLFKAFTQADTSTTRKYGGTGLGLIISNLLIEKMGGKIELLSEPGRGSVFFFSLETEYGYAENQNVRSIEDVKRILVVDDNDNNRLILEHTLKSWNIEFCGCAGGREALEIISSQERFDVIIVDYHMPELDGLDTISMIREKLNLSAARQPVILLHSSSDDPDITDKCKKLGVRFNLVKPVKAAELFYYLKNIHSGSGFNEYVNRQLDLSSKIIVPAVERPPLIILAEDSHINMLLVKTMIKRHIPGAEIIETQNGKEVVEAAGTGRADFILMDIQMPVMDGIEAARQIRAGEAAGAARVPIIALTAGALKEEKERCLAAGMNDFLTKPINPEHLRRVLEKYLAAGTENISGGKIKAEAQQCSSFDADEFMHRVDNDKLLFEKLLEMSLNKFAESLAGLADVVERKDAHNISQLAHSLKGASLNMCFNRLARLASELEMIEKIDIKEAIEIFKEIEFEWKKIKIIVRDARL